MRGNKGQGRSKTDKKGLANRGLTRREFLVTSAGASAAILLAAGCGGGEGGGGGGSDYPTKDIKYIVPFKAGSAPDSTFRTLSKAAEEELGQPIVIVNRPGGGGTVGVTEVVTATPDGYTIGMSPVATLTIQPLLQNTAFEGPGDVLPIIQTNAAPMVLFVDKESNIRTIDDYVQQAKKNPGKIEVGMGGGEHTIIDVEVEQLMREADIELKKVPYEAGQQTAAVVNGTVASAISQPSASLGFRRKGEIRFIGLFGTQKPPGLEDVPLFTEAGYDVTQIPYEFVIAPKKTPAERVQKIHDAYRAAMNSDTFQEYAKKQSLIVEYVGTEELQQKLQKDEKFYEQLAKELGWTKS